MSKRDQVALSAAIEAVYDINRNAISLSAEWLASVAMDEIGFAKSLHSAGHYGCEMHLREIARDFLRGKHDPATRAARALATGLQADMFPETLQDRYPRRPVKGQVHEYIQRDHLSEDDRWYNIFQMRKTSSALTKHSNALEAETVHLFGPRKDAA